MLLNVLLVLVLMFGNISFNVKSFADEKTQQEIFVDNVEGFLDATTQKLNQCESIIEELTSYNKIPETVLQDLIYIHEQLCVAQSQIRLLLVEYKKDSLPMYKNDILEGMKWVTTGLFFLQHDLQYWSDYKIKI